MSHRSESEGEIVESESEKATSLQHSTRDSSVDRTSRPRTSLSRSPRPLAQLDGRSDSYHRYGTSRDAPPPTNDRLARETYRDPPQGNKRRHYHHQDDHDRDDGRGHDSEREGHDTGARRFQTHHDSDNRSRHDARAPGNNHSHASGSDRPRYDARTSGNGYSSRTSDNDSHHHTSSRRSQEERNSNRRHNDHNSQRRDGRRGSQDERTENQRYREHGSRRSTIRHGSQEEREPPEKRQRYDARRDRDGSADSQRFYKQSSLRAEHEGSGTESRLAQNQVPLEQQQRPRIPERGELNYQQKRKLEAETAAKALKAEKLARDLAEEEPPAQPVDEDKVIEERRKRREAIRAKHRAPPPTLLQQALHQNTAASAMSTTSSASASLPDSPADASGNQSAASSPAASQPESPQPVPAFSVVSDQDLANPAQATIDPQDHVGEAAAADYDPSHDMQDSKLRQRAANDDAADHDETDETNQADILASATGLAQPQMTDTDGFDMFGDNDEDDMFAMEPATGQKKADGTQAVRIPKAKQLDRGMLDDWDDHEGYYRIILGELLDGRYHIQTNLGKGVFSAVVRALDTETDTVVAIKIIRTQESMYRAGMKEIETLQKIAEADPEDKRHIIRLIRNFEHKGHLCMVFENLSINLREVLKKFGRDIGINIKAVRSYAQQMFLGLSLLQKCEILHADLKPDNVLVNEARSQLKIADLGSAISADDNEVTEALVSRFYRAPEIMLGIKHDYAIDMWSVGCTLFELYTGKILFTGPTNNQMLKGIMECRGKIPNRMLKKSDFWNMHFEPDGTFLSQEVDNITRRDVIRRMNITKTTPAKELKTRLFNSSKDLSVAETKELNSFADLLDKCLAIDPARRITPAEALKHGFIQRTLFVGK